MSTSQARNDILYFIDDTISDINIITKALPLSAKVRIIASAEDGLNQILTALTSEHDISALHLISHGRPGAIVLGNSVVDSADLASRPEVYVAIGQALAADADLLIYGCNVGVGEEGLAFLAELSGLTGANVAASETLTGAAHLGGDWALDVRLGRVQAPVLSIPSYAGVLAAPTISSISPIAYTENGPAQVLQGATFSGGSGYANGSITFGVTGSDAGDQFSLFSDTNTTATGAVSVDSLGNVYLGNGTSRDVIGTVDATNNGKNGQPLTIRLLGTSTGGLTNTSFEGTTNGWTFGDSRVILGTTKINGFVTPTDLTAPKNSTNGAGGGIDNGNIAIMSYSHQLATDQHTAGNSSLRLLLSGQTSDGYDVVHGPYAHSNTFAAQAGDVFTFDWRAAAGGDAYDAFGYLMNADTGEFVRVLDATGTNETGVTNWATQSVTVPKAGNWFFVFVAGTYDFTGGKVVGGSLYIDNFKVLRSTVNDSVLTNLAKHVQYVNSSENPPDAPRSLTIEVADGAGIRQTGSATIDIMPINDAAVLSSAAVALTEADTAAALGASGQLTITDVDSPATFVAQTNKVGQHGSFSIGTDGRWTYVASSAHNEFKAGQVFTESFEVTSADGTRTNVTVTLTGTNDAPIVSGAVTGAATEDGASVTLDALRNASDADADAALSVVDVGTLPLGVTYDAAARSFTLDPKNAAYQSLAAGQTQIVTVGYNVSDGTTKVPASVSWTVTGTNDAAVVTPATVNLTETDATLATGGQLTITDVDSPATFVAQVNKVGQYGGFSIGTDGKWTYVASSAHNEFKAGQVYTDTFEVTSADGTRTNVTVNLTGTNDAPVVSGAVTGTATEDGASVTLDALRNASDADAASVLAVVDVGTLPAGVAYDATTRSFTLDPAHSAYQSLSAGQIQTVTVGYNVSDGTTKTPASVSWTLTGTNDAPIVSGAVTGAATEDGTSVTLDALKNASDADAGSVLAVADVGILPAGVTYDAATRSFTLDPKNAAYQALGAGQTQIVTVGYNVSDGKAKTPASVSWTVTGSNDAPVVSGAVTGAATKGGASVALDALKNVSDVDAGSVLTVVGLDPSTLPAGVTYNAASHSFTLNPTNPAYDSIGEGQTQTVTVNYNVSDGTVAKPASVSWTIAGRNTAAVLSSAAVALTEADTAAALGASGQLTITDVDSPATFVAQTNKVGQHGSFSIGTDGRWTYVASSAHNEFKAGQVFTESFEVTSADGTRTNVTVTLTGTNDAPIVSGTVTGSATEDGASVTLDALRNASDADADAALSVADVGNLPDGVTYDATTRSFTLDPKDAAYQALVAGQTQTVTVGYNVSDGTTKTPASVSWTVTGTNDAAVVAPATVNLTETDATLATGGQLTITDVDSPATFVAQVNKIGQHGAFSIGTDGRWTYVASSAHNEFKAGQVYTESFEVTSADGTRTNVTVNLTGTNDAPIVSGAVNGTAMEDGTSLDTRCARERVRRGRGCCARGCRHRHPAGRRDLRCGHPLLHPRPHSSGLPVPGRGPSPGGHGRVQRIRRRDDDRGVRLLDGDRHERCGSGGAGDGQPDRDGRHPGDRWTADDHGCR